MTTNYNTNMVFDLQLQNSPELVGLTEYLKKYIEIIKKETGLEVALIFRAYYFFLYYEQQAVPCKCPSNMIYDLPRVNDLFQLTEKIQI